MSKLEYEYESKPFGFKTMFPNKPNAKRSGFLTKELQVESNTATANYMVYSSTPRTDIVKQFNAFAGSFIQSLRSSMNGQLDIIDDYIFLDMPAIRVKCTNDGLAVVSICAYNQKQIYMLSVKQHIDDESNFEQFIMGFKLLR